MSGHQSSVSPLFESGDDYDEPDTRDVGHKTRRSVTMWSDTLLWEQDHWSQIWGERVGVCWPLVILWQLIFSSTLMLSSQSLNVFIRWRVWTQYVEGGDHHQHSSKWQYKKLQKNGSAETCLLMCKYLAHLHRILCNRNWKRIQSNQVLVQMLNMSSWKGLKIIFLVSLENVLRSWWNWEAQYQVFPCCSPVMPTQNIIKQSLEKLRTGIR